MEGRPPAIEAWVEADRRLDLETMRAQLADDVVLVSPLTDAFDFRGPDEVMAVFATVFDLLQDIAIERVVGADRDWVLHGSQRLHGANMEEVQWLHLNEAGKIDHITLFIRPVAAVLGTLGSIGTGLHKRGVLPRSAAVASRPVSIVAWVFRFIERVIMPRVGARR